MAAIPSAPVRVTDGKGFQKLRLQFLYAGTVVNRDLGPKMAKRVAKVILEEARKRVPIDTGALKSTLRIAMMPNRKDVSVRAGNSRVKYAGVVEFGRAAFNPYNPRPYLRPAVRVAQARFKKLAKIDLDPVLMKMFDRKWGYG